MCGTHIDYNFKKIPRRQNFKGSLAGNGAFYINRVGNILKYNSRLSDKISIYGMPEFASFEIDEMDNLVIAGILRKKHILNIRKFEKKIKLFVIDVDGVLTDGGHALFKRRRNIHKI